MPRGRTTSRKTSRAVLTLKSKYLIVPVSKWRSGVRYTSGSEASEGSSHGPSPRRASGGAAARPGPAVTDRRRRLTTYRFFCLRPLVGGRAVVGGWGSGLEARRGARAGCLGRKRRRASAERCHGRSVAAVHPGLLRLRPRPLTSLILLESTWRRVQPPPGRPAAGPGATNCPCVVFLCSICECQ